MEILKEAKRLYDLGFAIHWLHPKSKRPIESKWTDGPRASWAHLEKTYRPGNNLGTRTGEASQIGKNFLACFDLDIKDPACRPTAEAKLKQLINGHVYPEVQSGSGGGSKHLYCVTPKPFKMLTLAKEKGWEICLYSSGRQMCLAKSVHPNGNLYKWASPISAQEDLPLIDLSKLAPAEKKEPLLVTAAKTKQDAPEDTTPTKEKFEVAEVDLSWLPHLSTKMRDMIVKGTGVTDRSAMLLPAASSLLRAGLSRNEILTVLTDPNNFLGACSYDHAKTQNRTRAARWVWDYSVKKVLAEQSAEAMFAEPVKESKPLNFDEMGEVESPKGWIDELDTTAKGAFQSSLKNLDLILTKTIEGPLFVEDLFASRASYGVDTPWGRKKGEHLTDIDTVLLKRWLADTEFSMEPKDPVIRDITNLLAYRHQVHPVKAWLESLKWDGTKRIDTWLKDYCFAEAEEPYLSEVSSKFLLAMVKRVYEPGCQMDYVLVLQGDQGAFKSSAARALAGDKWFMDNLPDLKDKDAMLNLQGKWLIELGELANIKKADYSQVKAYLSRRVDTVRAHYGRRSFDSPRQSVFIGTVNEGVYLKDPTGNRRYWPVKVGMCKAKKLKEDREQIFAEAMCRYKEGREELFLSGEANTQAQAAQADRVVDDLASEMKDALIEFMGSEKSKDFDFNDFKARDLCTGPDAPWGFCEKNNGFSNLAATTLHALKFEHNRHNSRRFWSKSYERF